MLHGALDGFVLNPKAIAAYRATGFGALCGCYGMSLQGVIGAWHPAAPGGGTSVTLDLVDQYCFRSNLFEWCLRSADSARKSKTCSHLYTNVHSSTSHKSQKVEKLQVSTGKWVDSVVRVTRWDRSQGLMLQLG